MEATSARENPYDWINPIVDPELFAGREEELATIREEIAKLAGAKPIVPMVTIMGERRVGKTSLLRRIEEMCHEYPLRAVSVSLEDAIATDPWDFWHEVFSRLLVSACDIGILIPPLTEEHMGFRTPARQARDQVQRPVIRGLLFPPAYGIRLSTSVSPRLASYVVQNDLNTLTEAFLKAGYKGILLMLDEAHLLINAQETKQEIRHAVQQTGRCGIIFAGESGLGRMFADPSEPFFGQSRVLSLKNFTNPDDVAECALLPLSDDERKLVSPMTIDYLARLSQGKPNQIRLICSSMYNRYMRGEQKDLNITIDVLDDVIDSVAQVYQDPELRGRVDTIHRLNSVDLELLYNMTRYRDWSVQDIIDLDESFRGESKSESTIARRERNLAEKRGYFIRLGLMADHSERYILAGGEFLSLYLRFLHEIRNYGQLSRRLVLGKGPPTPFGEKTEKLVRSLAYTFGQGPELQRLIFHSYHRDYGDIIGAIKRRFSVFEQLKNGKRPEAKDLSEILSECFRVCELIGKPGDFYLLCLSVRNLDNPRELIQIELYFDLTERPTVDLLSLFKLLNQQAVDARVLIEGYDYFWVKLPDLAGLLNDIGGTTLEDLMAKLPLVGQWRLASVQHMVHSIDESKDLDSAGDQDRDKDEAHKWVRLYAKGDEEEAEQYLSQKLEQTEERQKRARLYNDRGYIRCGSRLKKLDLARRDLDTALDLHYFHLPLVLLNLSCLDIDEGEYESAIRRIEEALLLTFSRLEIDVSYLRLRLPENHLGFKVNWEQHPANVLEASYINLAYALLKSKGHQEALEVLQEGLALIPSSVRLKHALARLYLFRKRADLGDPIYRELSEMLSLPDQGIALEIYL